MAIVGGGESGSTTSRLRRCIAILKGSHACKPSKIILASQSLQKTICCPLNISIREIVQSRREEADGCDNEIRLGVNIWAKDKETRDLRPENAVLRRRIDFSLGWAPGGSRETTEAYDPGPIGWGTSTDSATAPVDEAAPPWDSTASAIGPADNGTKSWDSTASNPTFDTWLSEENDFDSNKWMKPQSVGHC
ncbi:hypothetical protein BDR22DRAFT_885709 [Usnea florida]